MERFVDLVNDNWLPLPYLQQLELDRRFYSLLIDSGFNHWIYGDQFPQLGRRVLLGLNNYVVGDMVLLDCLNEGLTESARATHQIDVFSVCEYRTLEAIERCMPGLARYETPLVGIWQDGALKKMAYGAQGRELIMDLFHLQNPA